jgi:hypothetical protein
VHEHAKEDGFYRTLLGLGPRWDGALNPDKVGWVSQQTPDGDDWLEYDGWARLGCDRKSTRASSACSIICRLAYPTQHAAAITTCYREDRLTKRHDGPQIGLDGE